MGIGVMRLFGDDDLFGRLLFHEDVALLNSLSTSGNNKPRLAFVANRRVATAYNTDLTIANAKGRFQLNPRG